MHQRRGVLETDLHTESLLLNVWQSDAPIVLLRLLHQETLLTQVLVDMLLCSWTHHCGLNLWRTKMVVVQISAGLIMLNVSLSSERTIEVRGGLEAICAVDVILHVQHQPGSTEDLRQGVFSDRRLLQDDHGLLVSKLVKMKQRSNTRLVC